MTDEEKKAEEYASEKCKECYMCDYADYEHPEINPYEVCPWYTKRKEGYLDGLAEGRKENEELKEQLKNNPYVQILQKEKSEMAEDFAKQIEKMKCCTNCKHNNYTYWQSHCNNPKVKICKLLMQKKEVICANYDKWEPAE